jgi:8-amino-7-oxononanoate synthase
VLGREGRGAVEHSGVLHRVDAVTLAFSKSPASIGGAILTSRAAADGIRASALPYVFSAGCSPRPVYPRCRAAARWSPSRPPSRGGEATAAAWRAAFDAGVSVNAVAYPAVAHGKGVLRLSVTATHTAEQLRTAVEVVADAVAGGTAQLAA